MLIPVLNRKNILSDLAEVDWLLEEAEKVCHDSNLLWKLKQMQSESHELYNDFLLFYNLSPAQVSKDVINYYKEIANHIKGIELFLSLAYSRTGGIVGAHFEDFKMEKSFENRFSVLAKNILQLLHEAREYGNKK